MVETLVRQAELMRRFGRFYTRYLGLLQEAFLDGPFPLPLARLIYELAHHETTTAAQLAEELGLDPGYLSRLVRQLDDEGLVARERSAADGRVMLLTLTDDGREAFARLNAASREQVESTLSELGEADRERLIGAMTTIQDVLGAAEEARVPYILRPHQPGDIGWVVEQHGLLYSREYGWDERFEGLVAEIAGRFLRNFDPRRERCWIAEKDGQNVGSVFVVRSEEEGVAQLRMLLVHPDARGLGIGRRLVTECTRFARQVGYQRIMLWTNTELLTARRLYEQEGYRLVREEPITAFGEGLTGQYWGKEL